MKDMKGEGELIGRCKGVSGSKRGAKERLYYTQNTCYTLLFVIAIY